MGVFVSYSSRDKEAVTRLTQDLRDADEQVWLDQRLAGGDAWWHAILEQIRGCDVFIFALSQNSIQSKPCQAELHYAQNLGLPILPVQVGPVDSMQLNPLATVQTVDYRTSTSTAGMRLLSALHRARAQRQPPPSPLPAEPPVPFEYLIRLYTAIAGTDQLSPRDQAALVTQLQFGLREDGEHDAARKDIVMLLTKLRDREDVTYRTRTDVDTILANIDTQAPLGPALQPPGVTATNTRPASTGSTATLDAPPTEPQGMGISDPREPRGKTPPKSDTFIGTETETPQQQGVSKRLWSSQLASGLLGVTVGFVVVTWSWSGMTLTPFVFCIFLYLLTTGMAQLFVASATRISAARFMLFASGAASLILGLVVLYLKSTGINYRYLFVALAVGLIVRGGAQERAAVTDHNRLGRGWHILLGILGLIAGISLPLLCYWEWSFYALIPAAGLWFVVIGLCEVVSSLRIKAAADVMRN
ncbi:TIR domain-containing protein [Mycobacterium parmense]|uniref:TIR domain-containing protein n=1 Tax=Mycobacterium parmense TaxID=185642 RepID=A0A7I7YS11_9MYCO|nr:TIR domain-containing protein [Mycobacterium parmense]MCV7353468.1 TIR domain-containing protein [Mycobacterium parmense]BBZ43972.1 hypothetical protein MPRM_12530 [Mycobacterium parmense]